MPQAEAISSPALAGPVRVLSDLHLGHPGCRVSDVRQLAPLIDGAATVIFNGDTSEERSERFIKKGREQFAALKSLCTELGATPVFITGNHDPVTPDHHALDLLDGRVFVTHGDVIFPSVSPWSKFHDEAVEAMHRIRAEYTSTQLEKFEILLEVNKRISSEMRVRQPKVRPGLWGKARTLLNETWPPTRPLRILKTWAGAHRIAHAFVEKHRPKAQVTILGHTHRPYQSRNSDRTVINTGAYLAMSSSTIVEIAGDTVTVRTVKSAPSTFRTGSTLHTEKLIR